MIRLIFLAGVIAGAISVFASPGGGGGSVCVAALPENARTVDHDYPGGKAPREYSYNFSVQIDQSPPVKITSKASRVDGLALNRRHTVKIFDAGKLIESFHFTFRKRDRMSLCLRYTPWYQTWQLEPRSCGCSRLK